MQQAGSGLGLGGDHVCDWDAEWDTEGRWNCIRERYPDFACARPCGQHLLLRASAGVQAELTAGRHDRGGFAWSLRDLLLRR
jgi:hypothetical protein